MKIIKILSLFSIFFIANTHAAMDHSAHRGAGAKADTGSAACVRAHVSKMQPAHLSTVSPGSTFSFIVSNIDDPSQVSVEVKRQPVEVESEFKSPNYIIRGKIPENLKNTAARIDVKVDAKLASCRAEDGWLLKISEN